MAYDNTRWARKQKTECSALWRLWEVRGKPRETTQPMGPTATTGPTAIMGPTVSTVTTIASQWMHTLHLIDLLYILQVILISCIYIRGLIYKVFQVVQASAGWVGETGLTNKEMYIRCRGENEPFTGKPAVEKGVVLRRAADGLLPESQRWKGEMRVR